MTDEELVERLRSYAKDQGGWHNIDDTCEEAADRIEQLVATNEALTAERDAWKGQYAAEALGLHVQMQRAEAAEAKLAKAVRGLNAICVWGEETYARDMARTTLAEIEGEKT